MHLKHDQKVFLPFSVPDFTALCTVHSITLRCPITQYFCDYSFCSIRVLQLRGLGFVDILTKSRVQNSITLSLHACG